jgi:hypothetical protein
VAIPVRVVDLDELSERSLRHESDPSVAFDSRLVEIEDAQPNAIEPEIDEAES